jgi:hypothetical protein
LKFEEATTKNKNFHTIFPSFTMSQLPFALTVKNNKDENTDTEIELLSRLRLAFGTTLKMLEATRDQLHILGDRMDRLREASISYRRQFQDENQKEEAA